MENQWPAELESWSKRLVISRIREWCVTDDGTGKGSHVNSLVVVGRRTGYSIDANELMNDNNISPPQLTYGFCYRERLVASRWCYPPLEADDAHQDQPADEAALRERYHQTLKFDKSRILDEYVAVAE